MSAVAQLGIVSVALIAGEALGFAGKSFSAAWPILFLAALFCALIGFAAEKRHWHVLFFFLVGLTLALRSLDSNERIWQDVAIHNGRLDSTFVVTDEPRIGKVRKDGQRWITLPTRFAHERMNIMFAQSATNAPPRLGERWHCSGWVRVDGEGGRRSRQMWVRGKGSCAVCTHAANPGDPRVGLARIKRNFARRLGIGLEEKSTTAGLHRAMLLGERAALPKEMRTDFIRAGTVHVFAISGLHVLVIAQFILFLLVILMFPIRWAGLVLTPLLCIYTLLIGAPPSAIRAVTMMSVYSLSSLFWRKPNSLTAWSVTLIGFALVNPLGLFGVGSMLSFAVMLGILLFLRWAEPFSSRLVTGFGVPFAAWAAGVPIVAHCFACITPGGLLANLIVVPLACASVTTSALGVAASFLSTTLASHINNIAALFTEAMVGISWAVARLPGSNFEIMPWSLTMCAAWYAGIILLFVWIKMIWSRRRHALV